MNEPLPSASILMEYLDRRKYLETLAQHHRQHLSRKASGRFAHREVLVVSKTNQVRVKYYLNKH